MTADVSVSFGASFLVPDIVLHKHVFLSSLQQCQFFFANSQLERLWKWQETPVHWFLTSTLSPAGELFSKHVNQASHKADYWLFSALL